MQNIYKKTFHLKHYNVDYEHMVRKMNTNKLLVLDKHAWW